MNIKEIRIAKINEGAVLCLSEDEFAIINWSGDDKVFTSKEGMDKVLLPLMSIRIMRTRRPPEDEQEFYDELVAIGKSYLKTLNEKGSHEVVVGVMAMPFDVRKGGETTEQDIEKASDEVADFMRRMQE